MSAEYANKDPMELAREAERDLNSAAAKGGQSGGASSKDLNVRHDLKLKLKLL